MLNSMLSIHTYSMLNLAIALSYIITRLIPKNSINAAQGLKFARYIFISVIIVFLAMPIITAALPKTVVSNFQLIPILKQAATNWSTSQQIVNREIMQINSTAPSIPMNMLLLLALGGGICVFIGKYINNIRILKKLKSVAYCKHKIHNIHILFSNTTQIPYCWSLFNRFYVLIPCSYLNNTIALKLAIRHELQHIRQGDTNWLHIVALLKIINFWNPFIWLWINLLDELQEFSCDESIVLRKKIPPAVYAQCLVNAASYNLRNGLLPQGALGIHRVSQHILYRRVNMIFNYKKTVTKKLAVISTYVIAMFAAVSTAYALNDSKPVANLTVQQVNNLIKQAHFDKGFHVAATPEVVAELNNILQSDTARLQLHHALDRMQQYKPVISKALQKDSLPTELLAVPLVESGYQPLEQSKNPVLAAGIWQIIPETGQRLGLVINKNRDDRLNTELATQAALNYLKANHQQFNDWSLAVMAYEIGEKSTAELIAKTSSNNVWELARSESAPTSLGQFVARFNAELIIMHHPQLLSQSH